MLEKDGDMATRIVAITGSYRQGGITESAVEAVLAGARERGAETRTIRLMDRHIEFCTNCRACTQVSGAGRGACPQQDDLEAILAEVEAADAIVLGAPVNFYNVTAVFRRFLERLTGYAYWPWGKPSPAFRTGHPTKKAVLVSSMAAPGFLLPLFTGAPRALKIATKVLGARSIGNLWLGLSAIDPNQRLSPKQKARAQALGRHLA